MANILTYLNNIKNALYGRDVRGSIHDGIKAINDEVENTTAKQVNLDSTFNQLIINSGNSNAEIVAARVKKDGTSYEKLGDRLNDFDEQFNTIECEDRESVNYALRKNIYTLKPLITFVDDDGYLSTYNKLAPLFDSKGVKLVSAVTSNFVGKSGYMTKEQILELVSNGHEIASHGANHVWVSKNLSEIGESYKALNEMGFKVDNIVYPGGDFDINAIREAKKFYKCGVNVAGSGGVNFSPLRTYGLPRITFAPTIPRLENGINIDGTLENYKAIVDYAVANNGWLIWMLHTNGSEYTDEQHAILGQLIDYIKSLSVDIVTLKEGLKIYGNKVDIGDTSTEHFLIGGDGKVKSSFLNVHEINDSTITGDTPYTYFPNGTIHKAVFKSGKAIGFPTDAGTLITYNMNYDFASFQYFYPSLPNYKVYYRKWNTSTNKWNDWSLLDYTPNFLEVKNTTTITNDTPYSYFPGGLVHKAVFTSGNAVGFPHNAGTLITYNLNYDFACFQYFYPSSSNYKVYYRKWNGTLNKWNTWGVLDYSPTKETKTIEGTTIQPNSFATFDFTLALSDNIDVNNDLVVASPRFGIEEGLTWTIVISGDKSLRLRIYNTKSTQVTTSTRVWNIKIIKE